MKIRKYIAKTMIEAMKQVRSDLGPEAIILSTKEIKHGGFLGMFKTKKIEVIATIDPEPIGQTQTEFEPTKQPLMMQAPEQDSETNKILDELNDLKQMLLRQETDKDVFYDHVYESMLDYLYEQEVEQSLAKEVMDTVMDHHKLHEIQPTSDIVKRDTKREIEKRLTDISFKRGVSNQKIIHFVGPTGVGKTTTLAKVAAKSMLKDNKKVAFITADTYRIAAIEQLKTYARILNVPIEVAYTIEDYQQAIEKLSGYDLIYVDTAGRNFRDEKYIKELEAHINTNTKVNLVLALTAKQKDIIEIYEQFNHLPIKEVIFTKLDETRQYGSMLNISLKHEINIAYLTNGQDVPDDLIQPSADKITDYLLGGYTDE